MSISYTLHKNHLTNGANHYRAVAQNAGSVNLTRVIDHMIARGSTVTKADALAVLHDYHDTIVNLILDGYRVTTPIANYGVSIKGNFNGQTDGFDPSRHRVKASARPGAQLRQAVRSKAQMQKQEATTPRPNPLEYINLTNGNPDTELTPGGMGQIKGHRLSFDPIDQAQGVFLMSAENIITRVDEVGKNTSSELIFLIPNSLAPGEYTLEVRAKFGQSKIRTGVLEGTLSVPLNVLRR